MIWEEAGGREQEEWERAEEKSVGGGTTKVTAVDSRGSVLLGPLTSIQKSPRIVYVKDRRLPDVSTGFVSHGLRVALKSVSPTLLGCICMRSK